MHNNLNINSDFNGFKKLKLTLEAGLLIKQHKHL